MVLNQTKKHLPAAAAALNVPFLLFSWCVFFFFFDCLFVLVFVIFWFLGFCLRETNILLFTPFMGPVQVAARAAKRGQRCSGSKGDACLP